MKLFFDIGEHVICTLETKQSGEYVGLDTNPTISIYDPDDVVIPGISAVDMTPGDTGHFAYEFDSIGKTAGDYRVKCSAVHSGRITITNGGFKLGKV